MRPSGPYDAQLHMFCDPTREPNLDGLRFMRWLAEHGLLEHETFGAPSGEYADGILAQPATLPPALTLD